MNVKISFDLNVVVNIQDVYEFQIGGTARLVLGEEPPVSRLRKISNWGPKGLSVKSVTTRKRHETEFASQAFELNSLGRRCDGHGHDGK